MAKLLRKGDSGCGDQWFLQFFVTAPSGDTKLIGQGVTCIQVLLIGCLISLIINQTSRLNVYMNISISEQLPRGEEGCRKITY